MEEGFNYCIGMPWHETTPDGPFRIYTYGQQIHFGDIESAKEMKDYVDKQTKRKNNIRRDKRMGICYQRRLIDRPA